MCKPINSPLCNGLCLSEGGRGIMEVKNKKWRPETTKKKAGAEKS